MRSLKVFTYLASIFILKNLIFCYDLSSVLEKGWLLQDKNQDGFVDFIDCKIVISDNPSVEIVRSASEIAFRISFESEGITPPILFTESELGKKFYFCNLIFLGDSKIHRKFLEKIGKSYDCPENSGVLEFIESKDGDILSIRGSNDESILYAVKNFFSRFPYLWEIYGRKTGTTFESIKNDIEKYFKEIGIEPEKILFRKAVYENKDAIRKMEKTGKELEFYEADTGEVKLLDIEIYFKNKENFEKGIDSLNSLKESQKWGEGTKTLVYPGISRLELNLSFLNQNKKIILERIGFPERMLSRRLSPELVKQKPKPKAKEMSFSNLFTKEGLIKEEEKGVEKLDSRIVLSEEDFSPSAAEIAFRLGLESIGITMPITIIDEEIKNFDEIDFNPVIIGEKNRLTKYLLKSGKLRMPELKKNEGYIAIVPKAFNDFTAIVFTGNIKNASLYFVKNLPFLWRKGKDGVEIFKIEDDINSFFKLKNIEGQLSLVGKHLRDFVQKNPLKNIESLKIDIFVDGMVSQPEKLFDELFKGKDVKIDFVSRKEGKKVFEIEKEISYEVDEFWKVWKEEALEKLNPGKKIKIDIRLSEPPEIRESIKEKILKELENRRFKKDDISLNVLCSYKQGFSWIVDDVIPKLKGKDVKSIQITFPYKKVQIAPAKFQEEPTRWLSELYPVDEIISRELNLPMNSINFEREEMEEPVYRITVYENEGIIFKDSFSPFIAKRHYLDKFPSWGEVTITQGGLLIEEDGKEIFRKIIKSDLQQFWEFYQREILEKLHEHIMKKAGNKPTIEKQPFFHTLKVELFASEPDYRLGIDEEMITSLESIHDEIYFGTLDFLEATLYKEKLILDEKEIQKRFNASGKIFPVIYPSAPGKPAKAKILLTDYPAPKPKVHFKWKDLKGIDREEEVILQPLSLELCKGRGTKIREDEVSSLEIYLKFSKEENAVAFDMIESLKRLREKGFLRDFCASNNLEEIVLNFHFEFLQSSNSFKIFPLEGKIPHEFKKNLIKFDHVTSPEEVSGISEILGTLPGIYTYKLWKSYEGRDIPVMEINLPSPSEVASRNKFILRKPTILFTGRQHGNEVSSTSYLIKLAELLATDEKWKEYLKKINVVIHPMENPDGAALAYELQKITPHFCLHAGRYTSLGADVSTQIRNPETLITEALFRNFLYERWKPDIYLNLHGYPSHEWVQQFSGYTPYLFRQYWIPRGWYAFITHLEHPGYPFHSEASKVLLEYINKEINSLEEIFINKNQYQRYVRWAERWQPHIHFLEVHGETNLYFDRRSSRASKPSSRRDLTFWEAVTEGMDETAQNGWLNFVCLEGLYFVKAHLDFLKNSKILFHREEEEESMERISITLTRIRPVRTKEQ